MKPSFWIVFFACITFLGLAGCDSAGGDDSGSVLITGQILNSSTNNPISGAIVRITNINPQAVAETGTDGRFTLTIKVDSTIELNISAFKEGFFQETETFLAVPDRTVDVNFNLDPTNDGTGGSDPTGPAASIILKDQSAENIGVVESGSLESMTLTFAAIDSVGRPVDIANIANISFTVYGPNGGEYVYPENTNTDNNGEARVALNSGTRAGVVQVEARATVGGRTLISKPVAVAIHGGLPDFAHFSVSPAKLNFPGYNIFGLTNTITAFVGDKYGNPVRQNTAVYFTTDGGIVQGSAITDELGRAPAELLSAEPKPTHATLGDGFALVEAATNDDSNAEIRVSTLVLFSGVPIPIAIDPNSFNIPAHGSRIFDYTVSDQNGNPLSEGTEISVLVDGQGIESQGDLSFSMPDTQSRSFTRFSFAVVDTTSAAVGQRPISIRITVEGPNGASTGTAAGIVEASN